MVAVTSVPGAAGPHSGYPQWEYNTLTKIVSKVDNPTAKAIAITVSYPAKLIFFTSQSAADAYMKSQGGGADISKSPINAAGNATTGIPNALLGGGIGSLFQSGIWTRVAEVTIGLMLLYVGLKAMTGVSVPPIGKTVGRLVK